MMLTGLKAQTLGEERLTDVHTSSSYHSHSISSDCERFSRGVSSASVSSERLIMPLRLQ